MAVTDVARSRGVGYRGCRVGIDLPGRLFMCTKANGLEFYGACRCAGTGCGGHLVLNAGGPAKTTLFYSGCRCGVLYCGGHELFAGMTPIGWQGAAQHTYITACDGHHAPGPCPGRQQPYTVHI